MADEVVNLYPLKRLGHMLLISNHPLPWRVMSGVGVVWEKASGAQNKGWHKIVKSLTVGLSHVGKCRLPD